MHKTIGYLLIVIGGVVMVGWIAGISFLKSIFPGLATMAFNSAFCFLFVGIGLLFFTEKPQKKFVSVSVFVGILILLIGAISLSEYIFNCSFGIDELLVKDNIIKSELAPKGRMSVASALCFTLTGLSFLFINFKKNFLFLTSISLIILLCLFDLTGYLYDYRRVYNIFLFSSMAVHTAASFVLFSIGILSANPSWKIREILKSNSPGIILTRRLLIPIIVTTIIVGSLIILAEKNNYFNYEIGISILVTFVIIQSVLAFWFSTRLLNKAYDDLRNINKRREAILGSALDAIISIDHKGNIIEFNPAAEKMFGYSYQEVIGKKMSELIIPENLRERHLRGLEHFIATGEGPILGKRIEMTSKHADGSEFPVELSIKQVGTETPPIFTGFIRDITERRKAEEALQESESDLNSAQAVAHIGSWKLDIQRDILSWSAETYRIFGVSPEKLLTYEDFLDCIHPDDKDYVDRCWQRALQGAPYDIEHRIIVGDTVKWVREKAVLEFDNDGKLKGGIGTVHDITDRKHAETTLLNAEKRYRTTLDHMLEGCQIIGFDWRYLYLNDVAIKHSKSSRNLLIGNTMMEVYPGIENTEMFQQIERCMKERTPHKMENEFVYPDGEKKWFTLSIEPVPEGIFILSVDITEEKKLQEELNRYNQRLEELVEERTAQLAAANKDMESFSYTVSHDLRAPLRAISGYAKMLEEGYSNMIDKEGNRLLSVIQNSAKTMGSLIDDLLALSRLGRKEIRKSFVDMTQLTKNVLEEINKTTNHRAEIKIHKLHSIMADSSLMKQVMTNLLANAIKYSSKTEKPVIEIGSESKDGEIIYFVSDNGAGFDMQYVNKLFGVFQRLHSESEFKGTGVGLAIVDLILRKHGGKVWAEGKVNEGATFYFSLPAESADELKEISKG